MSTEKAKLHKWDNIQWEKLNPEISRKLITGGNVMVAQIFFDGGPTPGDCFRAMVHGYREFASSGKLSTSSEAQQKLPLMAYCVEKLQIQKMSIFC